MVIGSGLFAINSFPAIAFQNFVQEMFFSHRDFASSRETGPCRISREAAKARSLATMIADLKHDPAMKY